MEGLIQRALARTPCLISFSGGRDSSALLALAVHIARRDGFELPIPATATFADAPDAEEDGWQRVVLDHIGISEQVRIPITSELDLVGPLAGPALLRHGLLWPANAHFHLPIFEAATGGSVLTGLGGDEIAACSAAAAPRRPRAARQRFRRDNLLIAGFAAAPRPIRALVFRRRAEVPHWLTSHGRRLVRRAAVSDEARVPQVFDRMLTDWVWKSRYFRVCIESLDVLAAEHDVAVMALARAGGPTGFGDRTALIRALFGQLLPEATVERASKGSFDEPLWGKQARGFVATWDGAGVDDLLVDVPALAAEWRSDRPAFLTTPLLQASWLHSQTS
jgi:asparagine synthase (glutamine-hydrolysing)